MRSEATILPQIVPESLGDKLNLNGICLVPIAIEIPGHVPELKLHAILKLTLKISSIEDTYSSRLCWTCFQKPSPLICHCYVVRSKNAPILIKDTF